MTDTNFAKLKGTSMDKFRAKAEEHRDGQLAALEEIAVLRKALMMYLEIYENEPNAVGRDGEWYQTKEAKAADEAARAALNYSSGVTHD